MKNCELCGATKVTIPFSVNGVETCWTCEDCAMEQVEQMFRDAKGSAGDRPVSTEALYVPE